MNFWTSPGFGGAAAVLAAALAYLGIVTRIRFDRRLETDRALVAAREARLADERDRWWDTIIWVWDNRNELTDTAQVNVLSALLPLARTDAQAALLESVRDGALPSTAERTT